MECTKCKTPLPNHARFCITCGNDVSGDTRAEVHAEPRDPEQIAKLQADIGTDYTIQRELGRGGMAIVYLGEDVHIGRMVAIKLLPPELTFGHGSAFIDRFKREARTAGTLDHPNIIPIFRVSSGGKLFWYVMKYIEGESLEAILEREHQLSIERVTGLLTPVADALDYAHRKNVIHRDVKPANVLVDTEGKVTVTDFGIAKALGSNSLTGSGSILGTPHYMSPEQCAGKKLTGASDQYSLAITAYQMFAGVVPFTGDSAVELIKQHTLDPPPPLRDTRPDIHERVVKVLEKALAKKPEDRYATVMDFIRGLQGLPALGTALGTPTTAQKPVAGKVQVKVAPRTPPKVAAAPSTDAVKTPAPRRRLGVRWYEAVGALALGFGIVVGYPMIKKRSTDTNAPPPATQQPVVQKPADKPSAESTHSKAAVTPGAVPADDKPTNDSKAPYARAPSQPTVTKQQVTTQPPPVRPARLAMRVSPGGATVTRDGEVVGSDTVVLTPGRHTITVSKQGFKDWSETVTVADGERLARIVMLEAIPEQRVVQQPAPTQPPTKVETPQATPPAPKPSGNGHIFIGTSVPASITVNGKPAPNPVNNLEVPAGDVALKFQVTDSSGTWSVDTTIKLATDGTFRRRFQLTRPTTAASRANAAVPAPAGASGTARIFIGTSVPATLTINGVKAPNPVNNLEVTAGVVRIHFEVRDDQGAWETDSTLVAQPGSIVRKRFQLKRPAPRLSATGPARCERRSPTCAS